VTGDERLRLLRELVELESPTGATSAIGDRLQRELAAAGAVVERDGDQLIGEVPGEGAPLPSLRRLASAGSSRSRWPSQ